MGSYNSSLLKLLDERGYIHQLTDAQRVCDRFVLLSDGRIRGIGTLADLQARTGLPDAGLEEVFLALT